MGITNEQRMKRKREKAKLGFEIIVWELSIWRLEIEDWRSILLFLLPLANRTRSVKLNLNNMNYFLLAGFNSSACCSKSNISEPKFITFFISIFLT